MLHTLLRTLLFLVLAVVGVVVLFVAWWMAVFLVLGVVGWYWFRRLFGNARPPATDHDPAAASHQAVVIEGEFEVESERPRQPGLPEHPASGEGNKPIP